MFNIRIDSVDFLAKGLIFFWQIILKILEIFQNRVSFAQNSISEHLSSHLVIELSVLTVMDFV